MNMEDEECIYDEVRQLVAVSPTKAQYDSKERVLFIFNKPLLMDGGPYEVEFRGERHCLTAPAILLNSCVIQTHAPVYFPPETTIVSIYDKVKQHAPFIARCSFEFYSRSQVLDELLEKATDPAQLLCDSLGVSTANITMFDEVIASKIQQKSPNEFHLLDIPQTGQAVSAQSNFKYPTIVHFGAAHGLPLTVEPCLRYSPTARQACALKNKDGMCPKEIAETYGHHEISEDIQDFQSNEQSYIKNKIHSAPSLEVNNFSDEENEDEYVKMGPKMALDEPENDNDYVHVKRPGAGISKKEITMTPELWKAIHIAEQAVNESWRKNDLSEETAKAFSQLVQKSAREPGDDSSPTYDVPGVRRPALPPKSDRLTNKRHSIHDISSSAPPIPPRSPRSPRSPTSHFFSGELRLSERRGSAPSIFHRMQQQLDKQTICEETTPTPPRSSQAPQLPARSKCPLSLRGVEAGYEWMGSDPNLSHRTSNKNFGSCNGARNSLTLPLQNTPRGMNGLQRQSDFQNGFRRQKAHSIDATCMGLSPRLPPRKQGPHNRSVSCDHDVPVHNLVKTRTLSEPT